MTLTNFIAKKLHRGQTNVKIQFTKNLTDEKTKRTFTWAAKICPLQR